MAIALTSSMVKLVETDSSFTNICCFSWQVREPCQCGYMRSRPPPNVVWPIGLQFALNESWVYSHFYLELSTSLVIRAPRMHVNTRCKRGLKVPSAPFFVCVCVTHMHAYNNVMSMMLLKVLLCSLESCLLFFFYFNAGSGNLQHSPTGSSGQAAIERPQGITVLLQFSSHIIGLL